MVVVWRILFYF